MGDDQEQRDEDSRDILEGFDLPAEGSAAPAEIGEPQEIEESAVSAPPAPHVRQAARPASVTGKLVALIVIPLIAVLGIVAINFVKKRPLMDYKAECLVVAHKFLKGLSDDTADSVPAAYGLLHRDLQRRLATETVVEAYQKAARDLGKFTRLGSIRWNESARSFRSLAQFDGGGQLPVWFKFARVTSDGKTEVQIAEYRFGVE